MDPIEKKIRELYKEKKREDEKSIPGFDVFRNKLEESRVKKRSYFLLRVAASVAVFLVAAGLLYYFYHSDRSARETGKIYPININQPLPSDPLLDQNPGMEYIWEWKAPTDKLLEGARESLNTELYKKI